MDNSSDDGGMEDDSMHCRQLEQPASSDGVNLPSSTCLPCAPALALPSIADELQFTMGLDGLISDIRASHPVNRLVGEVKGENMIRDSSRALQRLVFPGSTDAIKIATAACRKALENSGRVGAQLQMGRSGPSEPELISLVLESARRLQITRTAIGTALTHARRPMLDRDALEEVNQQLTRLDSKLDVGDPPPVAKPTPPDFSGTTRESLLKLLNRRLQPARRDCA